MAGIDPNQSPKEIMQLIAQAREKVGGEETAIGLVCEALEMYQDVMVNLFLEKCLIYHHIMMTERDNPGKKNKASAKEASRLWKKTLQDAEAYIDFYHLRRWRSRLYRFWGRWYDSQERFRKSVPYYKLAIKLAKQDPDWTQKGIPRWLELEGFLGFASITGGNVRKGLRQLQKIYKKYDRGTGKSLRQKDYATWAIWKTGIPIWIGRAIISGKVKMEKREYAKWLQEAEGLLSVPPGTKSWVKNFVFRKNEIAAIRRELKL